MYETAPDKTTVSVVVGLADPVAFACEALEGDNVEEVDAVVVGRVVEPAAVGLGEGLGVGEAGGLVVGAAV
mgnify:CR=1 FL=1